MNKKTMKFTALVALIAILLTGIASLFISYAKPDNEISFKTILANNNVNRLMDNVTVDSYKDFFKASDGTRYDGRIWSDKSVYSYDKSQGSVTLDKNLSYVNNGNGFTTKFETDFMHVFSVLGSSQERTQQVAKNLVIVLDNSSSMYANVATDGKWEDTRIAKTIVAINKAIDTLMKENPKNEVAVILFGDGNKSTNGTLPGTDTAQTIIPMAHYDLNGKDILSAGWVGGTPENPKHGIRGTESNGYVYVNKSLLNKGETGYASYINGTTNIQAGIYRGLQELLLVPNKADVINGIKISRIPSMVLLTDGVATDAINGDWFNPDIENKLLKNFGLVNDFSDKRTSFTGSYDAGDHIQYSWNQFIEEYSQDGYEYRLIGLDGNGETVTNPEGIKRLQELADDYEKTQGYMLLSTILTASYLKKAVENAYGRDNTIYTISVDMPDTNKSDFGPTSEDGAITSNGPMMNPSVCFNLNWLSRYTKDDTDGDGTYYEKDTVGSRTVLGISDAIKAYQALKEGNNSDSNLTKLNRFRPINSGKSFGEDQDKKNKQIFGFENTPSHNSFWIVFPANAVSIKPLPTDNPYNLTMNDIDANYVDKAYYAYSSATAANSIESIFENVINEVATTAFSPVQGTDASGNNNSLSYVDPIGNYLEVKNVEKLLLFGKEYNIIKDKTETATSNNKSVVRQYYKAIGSDGKDLTIKNMGYKDMDITFKLSDIKIWVEKVNNTNTKSSDTIIDTGFNEALHIILPSSSLPVRVNSITAKYNGEVESFVSNANTVNSLPLRILYTVGLTNELIDTNGKIDLSKVSDNYKQNNSVIINGKEFVIFNSNYYSKDKYNNTKDTIGNANITFSPSNDDLFYVNQENVIIYKTSKGGDSKGEGELVETGGKVTLSDPIKNLNEIDKNATYYIEVTYFVETTNGKGRTIKEAVAIKGSELFDENGKSLLTYYNLKTLEEVDKPGDNVVVATRIGSKKFTNLNDFVIHKSENITDTSTLTYVPTYGSLTTDDNHIIVNYLGNNGTLQVLNAKTLEIRKEVRGTSGDKNKDWKFTIKLTPKKGITLDTSYLYIGGNFATGVNKPSDGKLVFKRQSDGSYLGTFTLKHGQSIIIKELPVGTTYQITEQEANTDNYKLVATNNSGVVDKDMLAYFENTKGFSLPKTGELGPMLPSIFGTLFIVFGIFIFLYIKSHKKKVLNID